MYWVFGYGSLIWKPPPHAVERREGYVKGVVRRFAQSSIDHRGVPERPGRVVTVIEAQDWHRLAGDPIKEASDDYVWGVVYRIDSEREDEVRRYLEIREQNGYTSHDVPVYTLSSNGDEEIAVPKAVIWIGRLDNPAFVGPEPMEQLARRILSCQGPSGPNRDYLYHLAASVRELYPHLKDDYLFELEAICKQIEQEERDVPR
ncbi:hypothetical protein NliqN6_2074 [Naganishia liquefaciens]|uniref:glutathione-specific gamma-glutamylcyclotransferase n=1 Tax=Naganishia liquefaciens TaxID=104408 RepID=A0A8H3TR43_9TREE|nr:hypothetical protein NliqN6_2074 [Naganishia liquefaciens]